MGEDWLTIEADYYAYLARNCTDHRRMSVFHDKFASGGIDWASCMHCASRDVFQICLKNDQLSLALCQS